MKNWLTTNLGLKILSVFFAVGLWMIVVNIDDPVTTKTFKNVPVVFANETVLKDAGMVYQVLDGSDSVSFTVRAKRSVIETLSNNDFRAVADFAERISENAVPIKISALKKEDEILDIDLQNNTVKIVIEEEIVKTIPVDLHVVGNAAEGLTVGKTNVNPSEVTLSGPQSVIEDIDTMDVVLDATNASQDISSIVEGQLFDKNGDEVNDDRIYCSTSQFEVTAKLLHTKSVDLDFSIEGNVKDGYRNTGIQYTPTTVLIAGETEDLDKISTIVFPASELNIEGADKDVVKTVDVSKYLPDNLIVANDDEKKVTVTLKVVELNIHKISYPVTKIDVLNTPTGLDVNFEGNLYVEIILRGLSEDFADFSLENLSVSVDVKGLSEGVHKVRAEVNTPNDAIEIVENPYLEVSLSSSRDDDAQTSDNQQEPTQESGVSDVSGTGAVE